MVLYVILGAVLALLAVIGLIAGLLRGYVKMRTWAGEYVISSLLTIGVGVILKRAKVPAMAAGVVAIVCSVLFLLACIGVSKAIKSSIRNSFAKRDEDFRDYGIAGVFNRILGAIELAIKTVTIFMIIIVPVLVVLDFAQISWLEANLASVYQSAFWYALKPIAFDLLVIGAINLAIRHGFSHGIATSLWSLLTFGLIIGAGFLSYHLVFRTAIFNSAAAALSNEVGAWFAEIEALKNIAETIAKWIITAGVFLLMLIVIIVVTFFTSKAIKRARFGTGFALVDGIIGAVVALLIAVAAILFIGYLLSPLYGLDFMKPFDSYFKNSSVARYFFQNNLLTEWGVPVLIPLRFYPTSL